MSFILTRGTNTYFVWSWRPQCIRKTKRTKQLLFSSVQSLSHVWLFATSRTAARQASLSINKSKSLLKLMSTESVISSNYLIPFHSCLQSFPATVSFPMSQLFTSGGIKWFLNFLTDKQISLLKKMFLHSKRKGMFFDQFIVKHKSLPQYKHNTRHSLLIEEDFH